MAIVPGYSWQGGRDTPACGSERRRKPPAALHHEVLANRKRKNQGGHDCSGARELLKSLFVLPSGRSILHASLKNNHEIVLLLVSINLWLTYDLLLVDCSHVFQ